MEVSSAAFRWPESTKPWIVATTLNNNGLDAHLQTMSADSGLELAGALAANENPPVSIECFVIEGESWNMRRVSEVLVGMLGEASVAVFRDHEGLDFCPDAPAVPANQIASLVSVAKVALPQAVVPPVVVSANAHFHQAIADAIGRQRADAPTAGVSLREGAEASRGTDGAP
ncbi:hypothetical protein [Pseudorhodoferax sp. Leaf267]|uniref:hypothetical protein n=1 Tax=Pseudorhodoferax sp. Leaf267 TaxID=1736316 RepID=UPI0012E32701|nr:hypothetical protein [Pseudorhodoferax sp. Leaf267]